jgi:signal peptidase II
LSKHLVELLVPPGGLQVLPVLNLVRVHNQGGAFGLLGFMGNAFFLVVSALAVLVLLWLLLRGQGPVLALVLVLSGATGNLIDRAFLGYVRDFLDIHIGRYHWPAFNVADAALTVGLMLLVLDALKGRATAS